PWIYVFSDVWQNLGYNSIVYLAALTSISMELFDAAAIDGCNRFQRIWHVTLPGILPTIVLLLLMKMGSMMTVGYEKIILLYNDAVLERADVFSSFVYRYGMLGGNYSYSAAVDLFNNVVNIILLVIFNSIARKVSDISLW
ncbi:MAG: ABC transporter permease subunit, partial [Aristaeellaceae bacterium]